MPNHPKHPPLTKAEEIALIQRALDRNQRRGSVIIGERTPEEEEAIWQEFNRRMDVEWNALPAEEKELWRRFEEGLIERGVLPPIADEEPGKCPPK
jgi:hypothetical protein